MSRRWPAALGLALVSLSVACATGKALPELATLRVELTQGMLPGSVESLKSPVPVHVIADFSADPSLEWAYARRNAAARFLASVPAATPLDLRLAGSAQTDCGAAVVVPAPQGPSRPAALANSVLDREPTRPGSLGGALTSLLADLPRETSRRRIVIFSDFAGRCGALPGDPCAAAGELARRGAQLDLVAIGAQEVPACLTQLAAPTGAPPAGLDVSPQNVRRPFRVENREPRGADAGDPASTLR